MCPRFLNALLTMPFRSPWFPTRQPDGEHYMIIEIGPTVAPGRVIPYVLATNLAPAVADHICRQHNALEKETPA